MYPRAMRRNGRHHRAQSRAENDAISAQATGDGSEKKKIFRSHVSLLRGMCPASERCRPVAEPER